MEDLYFDRTPIATEILKNSPAEARVTARPGLDARRCERYAATLGTLCGISAQTGPLAGRITRNGCRSIARGAGSPLPIFTVTSQAMERLALAADEMQNTVDQQLAAIPTVVDRQREAATADLEKMLTVALAQIRAEREAVMQAVHQEQLAIREWVQLTADASADRADVITQKRITQSAGAASCSSIARPFMAALF